MRTQHLILLILLVGLLFRLLVAWQPASLLVQKTVPDDAYYYFAIARNVIAGKGVSVDGVTPTNGFHPLWALLLLLPYSLFKDGDLPIHLSLSLAALADTLAAWLAFDLTRRLSGRNWAGLLAGLLYALHPLVIMESQNGLETALAVLFFALTGWVYLIRVRREQTGYFDYLLLGFSAGLMLLARTDSLFLLLVIGIDSLLRYGPKAFMVGNKVTKTAAPVLGWLAAGGIIGLLLLPWIWWNQVTFGTLVQSSAVAAPQLIRYSLTAPLARGEPWAMVFQERYIPILLLSFTLTFRYAGLALAAAGAAMILTRLFSGRFPNLRDLRPLWLPFVGALLPVLIHTFVRWYPRSWYYVPLAWAAAVIGGAIIDRAARRWPKRAGFDLLRIGGVATLLLILALQGIKFWNEGYYPWQIHMLAGARWITEESPPDAVVASFNSGLQAYYGQRQIVNLDGVVNWEAIEAMDGRNLLGYARGRGATHLVDYQAYIFDTFHPFFEEGYEDRLQPETEVSPVYPPYGAVGVYEIR